MYRKHAITSDYKETVNLWLWYNILEILGEFAL